VIGCDAIHIDRLLGYAAKEVAPSNHNSHLAAERMYGCDLFGYFVDKDGIDTKAPAGCQSFS
jgi:hypothetical protein